MWIKTDFHMKSWAPGTHFEKEAKGNLEMAYSGASSSVEN